MSVLPDQLYLADQFRELDRLAVESGGLSASVLMQRAGAAAWEVFRECWPGARSVAVYCGGGNNAGDGYVFARLAADHGIDVQVVALRAPGDLKGAAREAAAQFTEQGGATATLSGSGAAAVDVIVDALFGIGLDRDVGGQYRDAIAAINGSGTPVLAMDIPSGLHADSGALMGSAVHAAVTVTFIGLKAGLFSGAGPDLRGALRFHDLGVPADIVARVQPALRRMDLDIVAAALPRRRRTAHKGDYGHVLVIGGDFGFSGAPRLAAEAAARAGSGLVTVATRPEHAALIPAARPELMACAVTGPADLGPLLERATVLAIGPGLGQSEWSQALLARVLQSDHPLVVDADALNLLAREPASSERWILTPHPGEAARLLGSDSAAVQADRRGAVSELRQRYGGVAVLKGAGTLVAGPDGVPALCSDGNPGMAGGGMGDVLTGVIAALAAQGLDPAAAARTGVCLHAAAADRAAADGERGMLAGDLMPWLRRLANPLP